MITQLIEHRKSIGSVGSQNMTGQDTMAGRYWDKTAQQIYNRVVNPAMVLWLGEAAGIDAAIVRKAVSAALPRAPGLSSMAGAVRQVIPWSLVEKLL